MSKPAKSKRPAAQMPGDVSTLAICWRLMRKVLPGEKPRIACGLLLLLATTGVHVLQPWPLKYIVDLITTPHAPPGDLAWLIRSVGGEAVSLVTLLCVTILTLHLIGAIFNTASTYFIVEVGLRMVNKLRCSVFDHVQRLSLRFHDSATVGDSLYRVTWDTYCVQTIFNNGFVPAISSAVSLVSIAAVMMLRDPLVTVLALGVMGPLTLLVRRLERPMTERSMVVHERESDISTHVQETLSSIRAVQAHNRQDHEIERFRSGADASLKAKLRLTLLESVSGAAVGLLLATGTALVVWVTAWRVLQGRLTPGDVVLMTAYVGMLYKPLSSAAKTAAMVQSAAARAWRVCSLLDAAPEVRDRPEAAALTQRPRGDLRVEQVTFAYKPDEPVLENVCLDIPAGSTVALVGSSGAGKTTLASLLMRFYDPDAGRITLDGRDLRDISLNSLRQNIALVLQEPILFATTVRENICYGRLDATDEQVLAAARAADADRFIAQLPDGYDTVLSERGASLSGGQRQRLSIARAFIQDAPILVMDEPTSALDAHTEMTLVDTLERLKQGRTTIIIAHRLSTIRNADVIVVLESGQVIEQGSHEQLLARGGAYAGLYGAQFGAPPGRRGPLEVIH